MAKKFKSRVWETLKGGAVDGLILYPSSKMVWAVDSMAKNLAGPSFPQEARLPIVTLALTTLAAAVPSKWGMKAGEGLLAAGMMQFLTTAGNKGTGMPGVIDQAVNKVFQPVANVGMQGYTRKLAGSVARTMQGYTEQPLRNMGGYTDAPLAGAGGAGGMGNINMPSNGRRSRLRGLTTVRV